MSAVVIERLPRLDYVPGCVSLPKDYGRESWDLRPEVAAIRAAVYAALDKLNEESGVVSKVRNKPVVIKPNLVLVYKDLGTKRSSYPETTDPRVLDSLVCWLLAKTKASEIIIAESSGRGSPTRVSFVLSGIDRLARRRGCGLVALEEQPVDRYFLPKATVQREILVPRLFSKVVRGEAFYISVPKLKTNLYTGVTLGFKNAMGVIPYNLRQRAHHYAIDRKLVEMLYLFKPDLVLIDGVVGGEGECPAPVDPVDSHMVIAGDHAVETDRVATGLMGFDPSSIKLMSIADELGFGSAEKVTVLGDRTPVEFRPADASLLSSRVQNLFPRLTVAYGIDRNGASIELGRLMAGDTPTAGELPELAALCRKMEASCRGGCVASTRFGLSMLEAEGKNFGRASMIAIGAGLARGNDRFWIDPSGGLWNAEAIKNFAGKSAAIGSCTHRLADACDWHVEGCMPLANAPHAILHRLSGTSCDILSAKNRHIPLLIHSLIAMRNARARILKNGERIDVAFPLQDTPDVVPIFHQHAQDASYIDWPMEALIDAGEKKTLLAEEYGTLIASLTGILAPCMLERLTWRIKAAITSAITIGPLIMWVSSLFTPFGAGALIPAKYFLLAFMVLESIHILELPVSLKSRLHRRPDGSYSRLEILGVTAMTLVAGFPIWLPYKRGLLA